MNANLHALDADCSEWSAGLADRPWRPRRGRPGVSVGHARIRLASACTRAAVVRRKRFAACAHGARRLGAAAAAAGWIPPATQHRVQVCGALSGWSLLLAPEACNDLSNAPCVIGISPCCRRWLSVRKVGTNAARLPEQERMAQVMRDEIRLAPTEPLYLPMSSHPRTADVLQALLAQPGSERSLEAWAEWGDVAAYPAAADDRRDGVEFCPVASARLGCHMRWRSWPKAKRCCRLRRRWGMPRRAILSPCFVKPSAIPRRVIFPHRRERGANQAGDEGGDAFVTVIYP